MHDIETLLVIIAGKDTIIAELQGRQQMAAVIQADTDKALTELRAELREWHAHDCADMARGDRLRPLCPICHRSVCPWLDAFRQVEYQPAEVCPYHGVGRL